MKRHLDPQNLPKTPSQEVFGRLGWRVFSGEESFEHRHLFTGEKKPLSKTNSPIFCHKTKQLSIAGRKIHSFHLEKGMNSPSNSGIVVQRDLGPLGSPFGGAGAGSFSPQVGRNWVLKSLSSRCGQVFPPGEMRSHHIYGWWMTEWDIFYGFYAIIPIQMGSVGSFPIELDYHEFPYQPLCLWPLG